MGETSGNPSSQGAPRLMWSNPRLGNTQSNGGHNAQAHRQHPKLRVHDTRGSAYSDPPVYQMSYVYITYMDIIDVVQSQSCVIKDDNQKIIISK